MPYGPTCSSNAPWVVALSEPWLKQRLDASQISAQLTDRPAISEPDPVLEGAQYTSKLSEASFLASMSRKDVPYDNAVMESFFSSLKQELAHHESFADLGMARAKFFHYVEVFYNHQRLHSNRGYRSPDDYEYRGPVA